MSQNPFYVDPGNDYSSGLSGLSNTMAGIRQNQNIQAQQQFKQDQVDRAQKRFEEVQGAAMKAFQSQDPNEIAKASIQYPEIVDMLRQTAGLKDELQNKEALSFTRAFATADPADRPALYQQRIQAIQDRGGDPSHTIQSYQDYQNNPDAETRNVIGYWAGIDPKGYKSFNDQQVAQQKQQNADRNYGLEQQKMGQQMTIAQMNSGDRALTRQIALLNAQQGATTNELRRQDLQQRIDAKTQAQQTNQQQLQNAGQQAVATFDQAIDSTKLLQAHPGLDKAVGRASMFPTIPGGDAANFEAQLDTLKAQTFLPQVQALKGMGALSDAEGKKMSDSVGALSTKMSQAEFRASLARVQDSLNKAKERATKNIPGLKSPAAGQQPGAATQGVLPSNQAQQAAPSGVKFLGFE